MQMRGLFVYISQLVIFYTFNIFMLCQFLFSKQNILKGLLLNTSFQLFFFNYIFFNKQTWERSETNSYEPFPLFNQIVILYALLTINTKIFIKSNSVCGLRFNIQQTTF